MATPLVKLRCQTGELWAKLEMAAPTGSVKDRAAAVMIEQARQQGLLHEGATLIEATSGNTGIALAAICAREGMHLKVVVPENVTSERTELLALLGAEIILSPAAQGSNGAVKLADQLAAADPSLIHLDQYRNEANPLAHQHGTAVEIMQQLGAAPECFVAGLGTGGTLMGCARGFGDSTRMVAVEPYPGEGLDGLRSLEEGFVPPLIDLSLLSTKRLVSAEDALEGNQWLIKQGIFAGLSSGAIAHVARLEAEKGQQVVFVVCDDGWRYRQSGLFSSAAAGSTVSFW